MHRKSSLIDLPFAEVLLIPTIFILFMGLIALLDSQTPCAASCPCIEQTP